MEVPAPFGGTVKEMKVKVGDKISEGAVILSLESSDDAVPATPTTQAATSRATQPEVEDEYVFQTCHFRILQCLALRFGVARPVTLRPGKARGAQFGYSK